ncbi:hypothetical protein LTR62_003926 [Meristemomyces frigidus]|uniref:Telomere repeat-binding factor dimerisation domain-containing protein n=1 Tax=Meristemomyces frigidus TaxID=1508187 RepID=A0AAN7TJ48_9PEZI|nr:hypothetical protein LTR62_003926 [Meristemomyces frigidus]
MHSADFLFLAPSSSRSALRLPPGYGNPVLGSASGTHDRGCTMSQKRRRTEAPQTRNDGASHSSPQIFQSASISAPYDRSPIESELEGGGPGAPGLMSALPAHQHQHWTLGCPSSSSYPDMQAYNQPYFFPRQTDPRVYTEPWPPSEGYRDLEGTNGTVDSGLELFATTGRSMPLFPTTTSIGADGAGGGDDGIDTRTTAGDRAGGLSGATVAQYANGSPDAVPAPSTGLYLEDAGLQLKLQSLSILDNLATQLIQTIAKTSHAQIQDLMQGGDTEEGQAYVTLKNLFDQTRKVYSRETPFIDALAIQLFQPGQQETIRKANIATFVASILGANDLSFFHLNEYFVETFVPTGHRLLKWQGAIYLELKTQAYISALLNSDEAPEDMLSELFPNDLDGLILTRHPDAPSLSPGEQDFIDRCRARKNYLLAEPAEAAVRELPKKYLWTDFVREFASCINKNGDAILNIPSRPTGTSALEKPRSSANGHPTQRGKKPRGSTVTNTLPPPPQHQPNPAPTTEKHPPPPPTTQTSRQLWSKSEESALLTGLSTVAGPHWSQILALYGRGGSVSEVLKDRNQVQLKDKARNLKLWYLKTGREVPGALRGVTGELGKRGGKGVRALLEVGLGGEGEGGGDGEVGEGDARRAQAGNGRRGRG